MHQPEDSIRYLIQFKHSRPAWFVLSGALVITFLLWLLSMRLVSDKTRVRFENQSHQLKTAIEERLLNYEQVLAGAAGLFAVAELIGKEDWHVYVNKLNIERYYPGIQGLGFTKRFRKSEIDRYQSQFSHLALPEYLQAGKEANSEYHPIVFLEPQTKQNRRAFGFDPYYDPVHRDAMELARDHASVAITSKVVLVQESVDEEQPGFVMYFPVYENGKPLDLPDQRREALSGFVFSAFRMNSLIDGIVGLISPFLDVHIYDSDVPVPESIMYASNLGTLDDTASFRLSQTIEYGGKRWLLETRTTPAFDYLAADTRPVWVLSLGLLVSVCLFVMTLIGVRSRLVALVNAGKYRAITENTATMTMILNRNGQPTYVSPSCERVLGIRYDNMTELAPARYVHPDDWPALEQVFEQIIGGRKKVVPHVSARVRHSNGTWIDIEGTLTGMFDVPGIDGVVANFRDVTELKHAQSELRRLAYYDTLTGLANRQLFRERLEHTIKLCTRRNTRAALLYLDLDGFKGVNDTLGHDAGDMLLKQVAQWLVGAVREEDSVARLGGDEFTILLTEVADAGSASVVAENVLKVLSRKIRLKDHEVSVSGSIGIAMLPDDSDNPESAMKFADLAMYRAKELGRNNYQYFTSALNIKAARRMLMIEELRAAAEEEQLRVYYLPLVDLATGRIVGLEGLLRWVHPDRGLIEPREFMALAVESGIIIEFGEWTLRQACLQVLAMRAEFGELALSINIHEKQFLSKNFVSRLADILAAVGYPPEQLVLEIQPSVLEREEQTILKVLGQLTGMGVRIVLDDFGIQQCSMEMLQLLPLEGVKLDQKLTCSKLAVEDCQAITAAVIAMAKKLNLKTIAEAVEDASYVNFLRQNQCDYAQGYWVTPPLSEEALTGFMAGYRSNTNWSGVS